MNIRKTWVAALAALALVAVSGCAVTRGQESVGAYVDDTVITTQIKSRMVENTEVAASSISVETLKGTVILSGFAKNATEKATAEKIARDVNGVKSVRNEISIRPWVVTRIAARQERCGLATAEAEKQAAAWERKAEDSWFTKE